MRTDELRDVLHTHAEDVAHVPAADRVGQVRGRVAAVRRRRAAVAAGGVVAAVAVVAFGVLPDGGTPAPDPAGSTEGVITSEGYTKDGVTYRADVLGEKLLGAAIGEPGDSVVSFEMTVPSTGLRISPTCYGIGVDHMVRVTLDGHPLTGSSCQQDPHPDPGKDGNTFPDGSPLDGSDIRAGDVVTVEARLTPAGSDPDVPAVERESAVVGVGIYEDTRPRQVVGGVEVPALLEHDGQVWELTGTYVMDAGEPRIWVERDPVPGRQLMVAAVSGLRGADARYDLLVDGRVDLTNGEAAGAHGPSWMVALVFESREGGTLELRVTKGLSERTRLSFVEYQPVD